jgi:hypothetical protein
MIDVKIVPLTVFAAVSLALVSPNVAAQNANDRKVEDYTCKEIMREGGTSRDSAIAFLHGFLVGRGGQSTINLEMLTRQTDAFIEQCLDNPSDKAMDAMMKTKS